MGLWLVLLSVVALAALPSGASRAAESTEYEVWKSFGPDGTETADFARAASTAFDQEDDLVYVLDDSAGILYKFNAEGDPVSWGGSAPYISGHEISGITPLPERENQVAVDSTSHTVYVTDGNSLRALQPNGEPAEFTAGPYAGTNVIGGFTRIAGIATDAEGYIYASDKEAGVVKIFKPSGEPVTEFPAVQAANLAVDTTGAVYVNRRVPNTVLKYVASAPPPVTGATTYTAEPEPVDPAGSFSVAVDPATNNVYIVKGALSPGVLVYNEIGEQIGSFGTEGELTTSRGIAVDGDNTRVYVGNRQNSGESQVMVFQPKPFPPAAPRVEDLAARDVGNTSATLRARINPESLATTYQIEYGLSDCPASACTAIPIPPGEIGDGHDPVAVSHEISGLQPASTYHYRVVAVNELGEDEESGTFHTQGGGLGFQLIDDRAWEMVSPPDKHGALISSGLNIGHIQAAAGGEGLAYLTGGPVVEDPEGSRSEGSTVLAERSDDGTWSAEDITSPNSRVVPLSIGQQSEYKLFSPDLAEALLEPRDGTGLSEEASERAPYWRLNSDPPLYRPLVSGKEPFANVPPDVEFGGGGAVSEVGIRAATPDLDHVVLTSSVGLASGAPPGATYKWHDGQLEPVSVLPGAEGGGIEPGAGLADTTAGSGARSARHAISEDGSRVFWTSWLDTGTPLHLYARDTAADTTARLDVPAGGSGAGPGKPLFQGASADGRFVFFTDSAQLSADASPSGADLYRCELPLSAPLTGCASLLNLSAPLPGSGESAEVLGIAPALSEDGTRAYFVARGALDTDANEAGSFAVPGEPNLYLWQEGEGVRFIAALSEEDETAWGSTPTLPALLGPGRVALLSAVASPSGRHLAFMSERSLTGEDSLSADWEPVERVFRYDAVVEELDCVSCQPTGAGPEGATIGEAEHDLIDPRSQWTGRLMSAVVPQSPIIGIGEVPIPLHRTRAVHDSGRLYFNAADALVPADSNGEWDVYQYEPVGVGTCTAASADAATATAAGGCVSLISSGTAEEPAGFFDAGVGGDDVFFLTSARLSVLDRDRESDIYDARVDGVEQVLEQPAECLGEACQPPPAVPSDPTPASAAYQGAGNLKPPRPCPKGKRKVKRKGKVRCVAKKAKQGKGKQKPRAGQDRGAAR